MRHARFAALIAGAFLATAPAATAAAATIAVSEAYIRAPQPGSQVASGYLHIANKGTEADTLIAVRTAAAAVAGVHEMKMDGPVMQMRPVSAGVAVPGGSELVLKPGGLHIMLEKLAKPLAPGAVVPVVLTFAKAGDVPVDFPVLPLGQTPEPGR